MRGTNKLKSAFRHPTELSDPLTPVEIIGSLSASSVMTVMFVLTGTFMAYYYTDVIGISAAAVGTLMLIARIINAFTDIGMGMVIAKTRSRHGRARPWILWMVLPLAITVALTFSVPSVFNDDGKLIYMYVTYILMITVTMTAVGTAGAVIGPSMTSNGRSREMMSVLGSVFAMIAGVSGSIVIQRSTAAMGDSPEAWRTVAMVFSVILLAGQAVHFLFTRERVAVSSDKDAGTSFKQMLPALLRNKYFLIMFFVGFLSAIDAAMAGASMYYYKYIFNDMGLIAVVSIIVLPCTLIGISAVPLLSRRVRKKHLLLIGLAVKAIALTVNALFPDIIPLFIAMQALRSLANGPMMALTSVFLLNTIEYGQYKTGVRADSLIVTAGGFSGKIGTGLGGALIGWLLALGGFVAGSDLQPESIASSIVFIYCTIPALVTVLQMALLSFYDLDKRHERITEKIKARTN